VVLATLWASLHDSVVAPVVGVAAYAMGQWRRPPACSGLACDGIDLHDGGWVVRRAASIRYLLGALVMADGGGRSWWSSGRGVAAMSDGGAPRLSSIGRRDGASICTERKLYLAQPVLPTSTPLGVDYLHKGVAVVIWSPP
jgi:hypothetical protein